MKSDKATLESSDVASHILASVDKFVKEEIEPQCTEIHESDEYPWDLHKKAADLGLFGIALPEEYGGLGLDLRTRLRIIEHIARSSGCFAIIVSTWPDAVVPIIEFGSEELKHEVLPKIASGEWCPAIAISEPGAGSDMAAISTYAQKTEEGYLLTGEKTWCTHGSMADVVVVFAKTDRDAGHRGITAFLVRKGTPGFKVMRDEKLTCFRGSPQSTLAFNDAFVPASERLGPEGAGFKMAIDALDEARLNVSAQALGGAYRSILIATEYAKERIQFGKPIIEHQGLQFLLAELCTEYSSARALWDLAIDEMVRGRSRRAGVIGSMAKIACTEIGMKAPIEAIQVLGAMGLSSELPLERFMRDAKSYQIYDGTTEIHKMIIGRYLQMQGLPFD
jgi:acyl-CoA dehydrogenase